MLDVNKRVGQRIKELRKNASLSQEQLSLKASINKSFMGKIERGEVSPTLNTLIKLVRVLDVDIKELFCFKSFENEEGSDFYVKEMIEEMSYKTLKEQKAILSITKLFFRLARNSQNIE